MKLFQIIWITFSKHSLMLSFHQYVMNELFWYYVNNRGASILSITVESVWDNPHYHGYFSHVSFSKALVLKLYKINWNAWDENSSPSGCLYAMMR